MLSSLATYAQIFNTDSLARLVALSKQDTALVKLMAQLSENLSTSNPDSAFMFAWQGLKLANELNYKKGQLYCKISLAKCWWSIGNYANSIQLLLAIYPETKQDALMEKKVYQSLTSTYRDQGDYGEALKYAFKVFEVNDKFDRCRICRVVNAVIASIYLEIKLPDSAKIYLQKGFKYPPAFGYDGWTYLIAGRTEMSLKNYSAASSFFKQSIETLLLERNAKDLVGAYNSTALLFKILKTNDSAIFYARKSLAISQPKKYIKEMLETNLLLSELYERNNSDSAFYYFKQAILTKDILYNLDKQRQIIGLKYSEEFRQQELKNTQIEYKNQIKIYVLFATTFFFLVIGIFLYRNNNQKIIANRLLQRQKNETEQQKTFAEKSLENLKVTQSQLIQSEKMASLGELTAGIAHEIQNPLNFVTNFSELNAELLAEIKDEIDKGNLEEVKLIANDIAANEQKINYHGKRADAIVKGMLQHSRSSSGTKEPTDINKLADEYLRLAYHGLRAKDKSFNVTMKTDFDETIGNINIIPQDIGRVILNLVTNAFYVVNERNNQGLANYKPTVTVSTNRSPLLGRGAGGEVVITVKDNGNGIPQKVLDKIFQPFFTTKPTGQGTGLGLSLSYDIVKAHGGEFKVETKENEGSVFTIQIPII